jgi:hypothetical protein
LKCRWLGACDGNRAEQYPDGKQHDRGDDWHGVLLREEKATQSLRHYTEASAWNGFIVIIYAENELCPATRARSAFLPY